MYGTYLRVIDEISDCKDMDDFEEHSQLMLKSEFGMNFDMFLDLLDVVVDNRIRVLTSSNDPKLVNDVRLGRNHALHDIKAVAGVLDDLRTKCVLSRWMEKSTNIYDKLCSVDKSVE